jgi:chemotaxis protein methyltransferase CheR
MSQGLPQTAPSPEFDDAEFNRFRDFIAARSGIYFDPAKRDALRNSLVKRLNACGLSSFAGYFDLLSLPGGEQEFDHLLNLITIHETHFFRDNAQLKALQQQVLPEVLAKKANPDATLRIWSAGCSTGEEPYTIAMLVAETLPADRAGAVQILATDVSQAALEAARHGVYRARSLRSTPDEYRQRYFSRDGDFYVLDETIKRMVEFRYFNLVSEPYPVLEMSGWDVIFCRNVTIYFKPESTRRVIHNFYRSLRDGGYLFTGFSESLRYISDEFSTVQAGGTFFYQKDTASRKQKPRSGTPRTAASRPRRRAVARAPHRKAASSPARRRATVQQACARAREFVEAGELERAVDLLEPLLAEATVAEEVLLLRAEIALNQGELDGAAHLCQRILDSDPLSVHGHFLLGLVCWTRGDERTAIEEFKKVVYLRGDNVLARFYLGDLYALGGQVDEAKR